MRAECQAHLTDQDPSDLDASIFDAETMPYLTAVCNETLRLYPTVPATSRHAVKDTSLANVRIPKGTQALVSMWAINRSVELWGPDAHEYNPDRWLEGKDAVHGGAQSPYSLLTFLHGPRSCIGQVFAKTEMKCLLAALIMRLRFEIADPDQEVIVGGLITIKPLHPLKLKLTDLRAETNGNGTVKN